MILSQELAEKVKGKSQGDFYANNNSLQVGPLVVNSRFHDYGETELVINIDTRNLTKEEVFSLIYAYVDALKAFPRVKRVGK